MKRINLIESNFNIDILRYQHNAYHSAGIRKEHAPLPKGTELIDHLHYLDDVSKAALIENPSICSRFLSLKEKCSTVNVPTMLIVVEESCLLSRDHQYYSFVELVGSVPFVFLQYRFNPNNERILLCIVFQATPDVTADIVPFEKEGFSIYPDKMEFFFYNCSCTREKNLLQ
jgi:hypothetical protein